MVFIQLIISSFEYWQHLHCVMMCMLMIPLAGHPSRGTNLILDRLLWKSFVLSSQMSFKAYHSNSSYFSFRPILSFVGLLLASTLPIVITPLLASHLLLPTPSFSLRIFSLVHISLQLTHPTICTITHSLISCSPLIPIIDFSVSIIFSHASTPCCSNVPPPYHLPSSLPPSLVRTERMAAAHSVLSGSRRFVHSHSGFASWNTEIETEEREQMGGGHTGCLFYNITPNNAVVISMTM